MIRDALFGGTKGNRVNTDIGLLLIRIMAGLALCLIFEKVLPRDGVWGPQDWFVEDVAEMGFPLPRFFAWCAALSEFVGGGLLVIGLLSRPAAFFNAITTFVAAFVFHGVDNLPSKGLLALVFFAITLALTFSGPGRFSIDHLLSQKSTGQSDQ